MKSSVLLLRSNIRRKLEAPKKHVLQQTEQRQKNRHVPYKPVHQRRKLKHVFTKSETSKNFKKIGKNETLCIKSQGKAFKKRVQKQNGTES